MNLRGLLLFILLIISLGISAKVKTLSICIGEYPAESGWNSLGADNDAGLIKAQFPDAMIISNENATYRNILKGLVHLKRNVSRGDTVIIHFSGHGQQILSPASSEEVDLVDEALVPYDASKRKSATYDGQAHIPDDVFGEYITGIRQALGPAGLLIAVVDACHSDSMDKDAEAPTEVYRGTDEIFGAETLSPDSIEKLRGLYDTPDESPVIISPELSDVVFISACGTHQRNYEIKVDDTSYGSLTYYFCKTYEKSGISNLNGFLSDLYAAMTSDKVMKFHGQTPVVRNSLGWQVPVPDIAVSDGDAVAPAVSQSADKDNGRNVLYLWCAIGVLVVIILILMRCRKRRK